MSLKDNLDLTPYIEAAASRLGALRMPQQYSDAIYRASTSVNQAMSDVMNMETMRRVKKGSNEVYQQVGDRGADVSLPAWLPKSKHTSG